MERKENQRLKSRVIQDLDVGKEETANQIEKKSPVEWEEKQVSASFRPGGRHWFH